MPESVVLTTYLTGKPDPQAAGKKGTDVLKRIKVRFLSWKGGGNVERSGAPKADEFDRMRVWYESLIRTGGRGVIFHDELSAAFVDRWTHPQVEFQLYKPRTPRSINDERYLCYLEWLEAHPEVDRVLVVDLFDVEFFKDPFTVMDDSRYDIYCGGDPGQFNDGLNREKMIEAFGEPWYEKEIKLNAGTCGGQRANMIRLLKAMVDTFDDLTGQGRLANLNMAVYNKCVYDLFENERIMYGTPLNSRFKRYEKAGDFAIRHK